MKLFVLGPGRHGKDTAAAFIAKKYNLTFESSSMFCAEHVVRPWLENLGITYSSLKECYSDRVNHREEWYNAIKRFNTPDLSRLSRAIFERYDMYVGIRDREEFLASKELSDLAIWIDASARVTQIDPTCKILKSDADIVVDNNSSEKDLCIRLSRFFDTLFKAKEGL